ncbi:MAG: carboxylating nicotinate-nucleotide diphosphorylase [Actinomycetota bacterium]|nr:carboxylating nicotinate-nucleotide diphosphorylase [Actinomycetota bacterium]
MDGDLTSQACVPAGTYGAANVVARAAGVVAGLATVHETFSQVDDRIEVRAEVSDGDRVRTGEVIARVQGPLRPILAGERTALNLLGHLSGIATTTRAFVDAVAGTGCVVRDTRKTMPGLRLLEKAAVVAGAGRSHRLGLHDALLVKDSHVVAAGGVGAATRSALARAGERPVQVEVTSLREVDEALAAGAAELLLDNLPAEDVRRAVAATAGRAAVEASGGITLANVHAYAEAGADRVAVGALTHSAAWFDVALELDVASMTSAFSEPATRGAGPNVAAAGGGNTAPLAPELPPREDALVLLAPEPDPADDPVVLVEEFREVPLSDAHGDDVELVLDNEETASGDEASDLPHESAG